MPGKAQLQWDDARFFLAVYREGSLSAAAKQLGCSHTTVRRRLDALEEAMGLKLFVVSSDGITPTAAAQEAFPLAQTIESSAAAFERQLKGQSTELSGKLTLTTIDVLVPKLTSVLQQFKERHPLVQLSLVADNRVLDLSRREADIAIRPGNAPDESLFGRRIGQMRYAPFASRELVDKYGPRPENIPWILWELSLGAKVTEQWYQRVSGGKEPVIRVSAGASLVSLAQAGLGGAVLSIPFGQSAKLVQLGPELHEFCTDVWCLTHYDMRKSALIRAFMDCARDTSPYTT